MKRALFVATFPKKDQEWADFEAYAERKAGQFEGATRLAVNVWLLNLSGLIGLLGYLIGKAEADGIAYGVLPIDEEADWMPVGFTPGSIMDRQT